MKVSGAFFYENIWRNKIVPCPKVQTDGTGNYFTAHSKICLLYTSDAADE